MNRFGLAAVALALTACASSTEPDDAPAPTTVAIKGTVEDCVFDGSCAVAAAGRPAAT